MFHRKAPFTFRNGEQIPEPMPYLQVVVTLTWDRQLFVIALSFRRLQIAYETWGHLVRWAVE